MVYGPVRPQRCFIPLGQLPPQPVMVQPPQQQRFILERSWVTTLTVLGALASIVSGIYGIVSQRRIEQRLGLS